MKNILIIFLSLACMATAFAQEEELTPEAQAKEKINEAQIVYISQKLGLTREEAEKFWPIYREFSMKRQDLRKQFRDNRKNPDPNKTMDQNEKDAIEQRLQLKQQELDLEKEYSKKLLNVVPAQKVMALRKAEDDFRRILIEQLKKRQQLEQQRQKQLEKGDQRIRQRNN